MSTPWSSVSCWMASSDTSTVSWLYPAQFQRIKRYETRGEGRGGGVVACSSGLIQKTCNSSMMTPLSTSSKDLGDMLWIATARPSLKGFCKLLTMTKLISLIPSDRLLLPSCRVSYIDLQVRNTSYLAMALYSICNMILVHTILP